MRLEECITGAVHIGDDVTCTLYIAYIKDVALCFVTYVGSILLLTAQILWSSVVNCNRYMGTLLLFV